jgi:NADH-quinone oxidoreductase subunit J
MSPVFAISATLALIAAVLMVLQRNPVYSAVWLLVAFLSVAVLFLTLSAPFLASIHVIVYTGAILVLFLFVIMLLNLQEHEYGAEYPPAVRLSIATMCAGLFAVLAVTIAGDPSLAVAAQAPPPDANGSFGSVAQVGMVLFEKFGLQFELVSVLIIVAMFGAVVLAKKKLPE